MFQEGAAGAEQLREALTALLGGSDGLFAASLRAAILLGESGRERAELHAALQGDEPPPELVRRALVETLMHGDRAGLVKTLDEALLGMRPRPTGYFALRAAAV